MINLAIEAAKNLMGMPPSHTMQRLAVVNRL
jgi:hypothetical protein